MVLVWLITFPFLSMAKASAIKQGFTYRSYNHLLFPSFDLVAFLWKVAILTRPRDEFSFLLKLSPMYQIGHPRDGLTCHKCLQVGFREFWNSSSLEIVIGPGVADAFLPSYPWIRQGQ